jgi:phospholipid/cholesterol/gamma-HCH transport system substrate-binding protein
LSTEATPHNNRLARLAALAGIIGAVVLVALLMFGGGGGYQVTATFENAGQLVKGNEVRIGGRAVGKIESIELDDGSQAVVKMSVDDDAVTPLHEGTTATIRSTSLSGIANRYVSLQPGRNDAGDIADGGRIGADNTTAPVDLDQLFNTLDPKTRAGLRNLIRGQSASLQGKGLQARQALEYLSPTLSASSRLTKELVYDDAAFERFIEDGSKVVGAIAERRSDLSQGVQNANTTAAAIGDENVALARTLALLPGTLRQGSTTFLNLRSALDDLDTLVAESKPATKDLAPFLAKLRPLVHDAEPTIRDLRVLIRKRGANNDLIELTGKLPRLRKLTASVFPRTIRTEARATPVVQTARQYTPDLAGWLTKFGQGANAYDANGHYARIQPIFSPFSVNDVTGLLTAVLPQSRLAGFSFKQSKRCPGGAMQEAPDGSSNVPVPGCDPGTVMP